MLLLQDAHSGAVSPLGQCYGVGPPVELLVHVDGQLRLVRSLHVVLFGRREVAGEYGEASSDYWTI